MPHKRLARAQPAGQAVHYYFPQRVMVVALQKRNRSSNVSGRGEISRIVFYTPELSRFNRRVSGHFHNNACHYMPSKRELYTGTYILLRYAGYPDLYPDHPSPDP